MERSASNLVLAVSAIRGFGVLGALIWLTVAIPDRSALRLGWLALFAGVFALGLLLPERAARTLRFLLLPRPAIYVAIVTVLAVALSVAFVHGPMMDKAVAIDSNVYLFEARMLSQGSFGFDVPPPRLAYSARFLFEGPDGRLFGVFPPGYPLFLAPFVKLGVALWAGPVTAALWVLAQNALGRSVLRAGALGDDPALIEKAELGHRLGLLVPLFAFERTLHTSDLLSHAFVGALAAFAIASALDLASGAGLQSGRGVREGAGLGAMLGWIFCARLLDGVLIGAAAAVVIAVGIARRKVRIAHVGAIVLCALPFLGLLAAQQKAATGSPTLPTQTEYFVRSDWPPTCHRIGFGADVGCTVEHPDVLEKIGTDGYGLGDAWRVVRERGGALGQDLFGVGLLGVFGFLLLWKRPHPALAAVAGTALAIVLGYGLFYFGNVQWYGGRHVLPAAAFLYVLAGHGLMLVAMPKGDGASKLAQRAAIALPFAAAATMLFSGQPAWSKNSTEIEQRQSARSDVRRTLARHTIDKGIFRSSDSAALVAGLDPARDGRNVHLVSDDKSGLLDVRRFYPELPLILSLEKDEVGRALGLAPPPPGILVELERAWPTFQRPHGLSASPEDASKLTPGASGQRALVLRNAAPGASLRVPFDVATTARYALRVAAYYGPEFGTYAIGIDGAPLTEQDFYAPALEYRKGADLDPRELTAGRHELTFEVLGKNPDSRAFSATIDALVGSVR